MENKTINKLTKDICKRCDITFENDVKYIKLCIQIAYTAGIVISNKHNEKYYKFLMHK